MELPMDQSRGSTAPQAEDSSWLSDNDFMMYKFKVLLCNKHYDHNMDTCPYAHKGERTCKRRDPARVNYTSIICLDMMQKGKCPRGRSCTSAHTIYEYWLHPHRYRTEMCKVGPTCTRRICFFAHKPEELRPLPPHLEGTSGGASTGKYSLSATRQAAAAAASAAAAAGARAGFYSCSSASAAAFAQQQQPQPQMCAFPGSYPGLGYSMYGAAALMPPGVAAIQFSHNNLTGSLQPGSPFGGVAMHGIGSQQQPVVMVSSGMVQLPGGDTTPTWQQQQQQQSNQYFAPPQQAAGGDLMVQMQRLRLASLTGSNAACGPGSAGQSPSHSMLSLCTLESTSQASAQQQFSMDDSNTFLHSFQQQQQLLQTAAPSLVSKPALVPPVAVRLQPQQQQPRQLLQMLAAPQNVGYVKSMAGMHAATSAAPTSYQPDLLAAGSPYMTQAVSGTYLGQLASMKPGPYGSL